MKTKPVSTYRNGGVKKLRKTYLVAFVTLALSVACFAVAGYAFWQAQILINRWNAYLEAINNFPWPTGGPDPRFEKMLSDHIAAWQTTGFALIFSGISLGILPLFFYKKTRPIAVKR